MVAHPTQQTPDVGLMPAQWWPILLNKRQTLAQCRYNGGTSYSTNIRHWPNAGTMVASVMMVTIVLSKQQTLARCRHYGGRPSMMMATYIPSNRRWPNAGTMVAHILLNKHHTLAQCRHNSSPRL